VPQTRVRVIARPSCEKFSVQIWGSGEYALDRQTGQDKTGRSRDSIWQMESQPRRRRSSHRMLGVVPVNSKFTEYKPARCQ